MKFPSLQVEKKLWQKGHKRVVCLDEAGRGPLAGPVVAAAIINFRTPTLPPPSPNCIGAPRYDLRKLSIKDSKKITPKKRKELYKILTKHPDIKWGIGRVSEKVIDKINILEATKLAMKRAIENLKIKNKKLKIDHLILDGKMKLDLSVPQKSIIKADEKVFSCAAASIIAKVTRDRIMEKYHKKYRRYGFNLHKGYPTKYHLKMLKKYGPCKIHRKSFSPVKACKLR